MLDMLRLVWYHAVTCHYVTRIRCGLVVVRVSVNVWVGSTHSGSQTRNTVCSGFVWMHICTYAYNALIHVHSVRVLRMHKRRKHVCQDHKIKILIM
jgi:hypothetical protein